MKSMQSKAGQDNYIGKSVSTRLTVGSTFKILCWMSLFMFPLWNMPVSVGEDSGEVSPVDGAPDIHHPSGTKPAEQQLDKTVAPKNTMNTVPADAYWLPAGLKASLARKKTTPPADAESFVGVGASALTVSEATAEPASESETTDITKTPAVPRVHALGLIPAEPSQEPAAEKVLQELRAKRTDKEEMPAAWDNSAGLPPVGDQGAQGSCVSWVTGYYIKSYQEAQEHGWALNDSLHQFSPRFIYNQLQGFDQGSTFEDNLDFGGCNFFVDNM